MSGSPGLVDSVRLLGLIIQARFILFRGLDRGMRMDGDSREIHLLRGHGTVSGKMLLHPLRGMSRVTSIVFAIRSLQGIRKGLGARILFLYRFGGFLNGRLLHLGGIGDSVANGTPLTVAGSSTGLSIRGGIEYWLPPRCVQAGGLAARDGFRGATSSSARRRGRSNSFAGIRSTTSSTARCSASASVSSAAAPSRHGSMKR
mmetsp:Transcript_11385/g.23335  ORF Transcript_11385/g.23335 Transcript_11385/m.23335 type:complete len:202 (-) Transcript_11385:65-670(-)